MLMSGRKLLFAFVLTGCLAIALYLCLKENSEASHAQKAFLLGRTHSSDIKHAASPSSPYDKLEERSPMNMIQLQEYSLADNYNGTEADKEAYKRSLQYCNPIAAHAEGEEGIVSKRFKLNSVHIIIRHGDRAPMNKLPNQDSPRLGCRLDASVSDVYGHLVTSFLQRMKEYGDDIVYSRVFGLYPKRKVCDEAQLTGIGAAQHLVNGDHLREMYIEKHHLLSENPRPGEILVKTTGYSRTFQSALAFLYGFVPDHDMRTLMFKLSHNLQFCSKAGSGVTCYCPAVRKLKDISKREESVVKSNLSELRHSLKVDLSSIYGITKSQVPSMWLFGEVLMGYFCHGMTLPCVETSDDTTSEACLSLPIIGKLWKYLDWHGELETFSRADYKHNLVVMYPLLKEIAQGMINTTKQQRDTKLTLYSGHDFTVKPLLKALGIHDGLWPPYASRIVFELYSDSNLEYFMRVLYNGKDKTSSLLFCKHAQMSDGLCPLSNFVKYVFKDVLAIFGKASYMDICVEDHF